MYKIKLYLIFAALLCIAACQKNSNELPTSQISFTKTVYTNYNDAKVDAYFTKHVAKYPYSLTVHFKARPGITLTNARILVDYYTDNASYNTMLFPTQILIPELNSTTISQEVNVSITDNANIDTMGILVCLLSASGNDSVPYSGYYIGKCVSDTALSNYSVKGYIDASGNTAFYINNSQQLTVKGIFSDSTTFLNGKVFNVNNIELSSNVNYNIDDYAYAADTLHFHLLLDPPLLIGNNDSLHSIIFSLKKQL